MVIKRKTAVKLPVFKSLGSTSNKWSDIEILNQSLSASVSLSAHWEE